MFKDDFTTVARANHLALTTERSYWHFAKHYIKWIGAKSRDDLLVNPTENFRKYLSQMANSGDRIEGDEGVSASTQNGAFHAIRFLLVKVLGIQLGDLSGIPRAISRQRIVQVPDQVTAARIVLSIPGQAGIAIRLIYGTGARLNDIVRLRVKDMDFERRLVAIQQSKGGKSRLVPMPESLVSALAALVRDRASIHNKDLESGLGWVHMPNNLAAKYPSEQKSLGWQYVFYSHKISKDPITGNFGRYHILDVTLQRAFLDARLRLGIATRYTIHSLRHSAAQFWERKGMERSRIQLLLGHSNSSTTDLYLASGIKSVANVPTPI